MKKLLTLLLLSLIGLTSKAQIVPNDTLHIFFSNPYQYGCCVNIAMKYSSSTQSLLTIGLNPDPHIIFPGMPINASCSRFTEALIVFPHDTTMLVHFIQAGHPVNCFGTINHYCTWDALDSVFQFSTLHAWFFPLCSDTIPTGINNISKTNKKVVRILDEMGRDTKPESDKVLIYLYDDGTIERKFKIKN